MEAKENALVDSLCGKRYCRERHDFVRQKTKKRIILTRYGRFERLFVYVKDVKTGESYSPLLRSLDIEKGQRCSRDFKQVLARKVSRMPYRKSVEDTRDSFGFSLSRMTLHRYAQDEASDLPIEQEVPSSHCVILADGTKVPGAKRKLEPRVIMSIGGEASDKALVRYVTGMSWKEMRKDLDLSQFRVLVGDGEPGLKEALCDPDMRFHYCHVHAIRDVGLCLWKDGLSHKKAEPFCKQFERILYCLQTSTEKHKQDKDWARLSLRIGKTKTDLRSFAAHASAQGLHSTAAFVLSHKDDLTTVAEFAILGIYVPWTTNPIERVMQEIGIRTKKKGMYWSTPGLDRILRMVLKRYFLPTNQRTYKDVFTTSTQEVVKS
ncbi:MAG: hypothetical protein HY619_06080 [Thaumarchaeota archaeon]|nr:hypothetical protein [Nitrososphaerota archaeon]